MDTGLLNLGEEHFSTFNVFEEYNTSDSLDRPDYMDCCWENEREINGDIALIPVSSSFTQPVSDLSQSPPSEFFHKFVDWTSFINIDVVDPHSLSPETTSTLPPQDIIEPKCSVKSEDAHFDSQEINNFDLAAYINGPDEKPKLKAAVKKIDKEAQKYIVETNKTRKISESTEDVDVETVYEPSKMPVLEATDVFGLLEQFEASEKPNSFNVEKMPEQIFDDIKIEVEDIETKEENLLKVDNKEEKPIVAANPNPPKREIKIEKKQDKSDKVKEYAKNKQILDALPQELIARVNESGKRKTITVIPPIPNNRKRGASKTIDSASQIKNKIPKIVVSNNNNNNNNSNNNHRIQLDHDYCSHLTPYPKEPVKDSGFESAEEEERSIIRNQPTVKNADGKLMVSLLKVNTIRTKVDLSSSQKKKLNLEEYKKRRSINSNTTSLSNSPSSSTCSSPLPEDDGLKHLKYEEKLKKMKEELLNTPPKSVKSANLSVLSEANKKPLETYVQEIVPKVTVSVEPPPDMERLVVVSVATNTEITEDVKALSELEDLGPLLQKASNKINSSSLITSLIENIPKVVINKGLSSNDKKTVSSKVEDVVREDKVIVYLPKNRPAVQKRSVKVQTMIGMLSDDVQSRYRRRIDRSPSPTASNSSGSTYRGRSSRCSRRSYNSSRRDSSSSSFCSRASSSRSRSRSISPKRPKYNPEYVREVEERRVVYVGRLIPNTTHDDLRKRFQKFGPIKNIKINHRDDGDPYGFVTFANREDAYKAVEHGNDGYVHPKYDLSFGGRRLFCQTSYSDLDNMRDEEFTYGYMTSPKPKSEESFDALLKAFQTMRKRKP